MATSSWYTTDNEYIHWRFEVTVNSQSIQNNTSNVTVRMFVARTNSYVPGTQGHGTAYCEIDGSSYSEYHNHVDEDVYITRSGLYMFTRTVTIPHNADGSKSLTVEGEINYSRFTATNQTFTVVLPAIARATVPEPSASAAYMGSSITISLPRALNTYTHTLEWKWSGSSYTTIASGVATSYTWTIPDITTSLPNAAGTTYTIRATTYNGADLVGTQTATFTALVPAAVVPTLSAPTLTELTAAVSSQFSVFVQTKSAIRVAINASGASGSTITGYAASFLGTSYSGQTFDTPVINNAGSLPLTITVTDSRGRTATATYTVSVAQLTPPQIQTFTVQRCRLDRTPDDSGDYIAMTIVYSVASLGGDNTASFEVGSKQLPNDPGYTTFYTNSSTTVNTVVYPVSQFSSDYQWEFEAALEDYWTSGSPTTAYASIASGAAMVDFNAAGDGAAFGMVSRQAGMELAPGWPLVVNDDISADGDIAATGDVSGDDVSASGNVTAGTALVLPIGTIYGIAGGTKAITNSTTTLSFGVTFAHVPIVLTSWSTTGTWSGTTDFASIKVDKITKSDCQIRYGGSTTSTRDCQWIAIDIG